MYSASNLFRKAYKFCTKNYDDVAIISAEYGLLLPTEQIKPYNKTLNDMTGRERDDWAKMVFQQMTSKLVLRDYSMVFFHAGKNYRDHLITKLESVGLNCKVPLANLQIGKQLAWYSLRGC